MIERLIIFTIMIFPTVSMGAQWELDAALDNARSACIGISSQFSQMKTQAIVGTVVTGVGTVAGGVALGTGIAKSNVDKHAAEIEQELARLDELAAAQDLTKLQILDFSYTDATVGADAIDERDEMQSELDRLENKSKNLGNWRTATLGINTATNVAGAILAGTNGVDGDLYAQIDECVDAIKNVSDARMQEYVSGDYNMGQIQYAERVVTECGAWESVNLSAVTNRARGAAISSGVGAGIGLAGTIASAVANSDKTRNGDATRERNLNNTANVLAGGATVASATATIFNASQISAINHILDVADACMGVLE